MHKYHTIQKLLQTSPIFHNHNNHVEQETSSLPFTQRMEEDATTSTNTTTTNMMKWNRLIVYDCRGSGIDPELLYHNTKTKRNPLQLSSSSEKNQNRTNHKLRWKSSFFYKHNHDNDSESDYNTTKLAVMTISSEQNQIYNLSGSGDQGLIPPAVHPVILSSEQTSYILDTNCSALMTNTEDTIHQQQQQQRPYLLTYTGNLDRSHVRVELRFLHDPQNDIIITDSIDSAGITNVSYTDLLTLSEFAAIPRGYSLYSFYLFEKNFRCIDEVQTQKGGSI